MAVYIGLAACIFVLLAGGVYGALTIEAEGPGGSGDGLGGSAPLVEPGPPAPPVDLAAVIAPGPAGFDQIPDASLLAGGPVDIERLAAERGEETRAVFQETRLVNGFIRAWQKPASGELVTVRLYQFADEKGAASYSKRVVQAMSKAPATTFVVPATDDTAGIDTHVDQGANRLAYVFARRGRVVAAIAATAAPPPEAGFLAPLARTQLELLPR
ncbi:MAG: hypothetical protein WKF86_05865 [Acidimicrobiales bacterium]